MSGDDVLIDFLDDLLARGPDAELAFDDPPEGEDGPGEYRIEFQGVVRVVAPTLRTCLALAVEATGFDREQPLHAS